MAQSVNPIRQFAFSGVVTSGNPARRPMGTAAACENLRIMPGGWLRIKGGRKARRFRASGEVRQFITLRTPAAPGSTYHYVQDVDAGNCYFRSLDVNTFAFNPFLFEQIATAYDSGFALTSPIAHATLQDRLYYYNGLGVRDGSNSRPALSSTGDGQTRYVGLDAYCVGGNPSAAWANDSGAVVVTTSREVWVGLHNTATGHFSNGVYAGTISSTAGADGTITVSNLQRLKTAYHDASEQNELKYVFYITLDGGAVPYLLLNGAGDDTYMVASTSGSATLSFSQHAATGGLLVDVTAEMPTDNFPPRPMRTACYVNGRVYYTPLIAGSGSAVVQRRTDGTSLPDFSYIPQQRSRGCVGWSAAASDEVDRDFVGNPHESYPLTNLKPTPSAEVPLLNTPTIDGVRVLAIMPNSTAILEEAADGLHEWTEVSSVHGIGYAATFVKTPYGQLWLTQRNQLVQLDAADRLSVISGDYQSLMTGKTPRCAAYILDPLNEIDRYQVWFSDNTSVIHDFAIGGQAYSATQFEDYTAVATVFDPYGRQVHLAAKKDLYTIEAQPEDGLIPTRADVYDGAGVVSASEITGGQWIGNWTDFGTDLQKEIATIAIYGDGDTSAQIGASPLTLEWYADFEQVTGGNKKTATITKQTQNTTEPMYKASLSAGKRTWFKFVFKVRGHASEGPLTHPAPATQGDLLQNFYASIVGVLLPPFTGGQNRQL